MRKQPVGQPGSNLAEQLDAYTVLVRAKLPADWTKWLRGWTRYAAALGSGLALTTAADADIVYSGPVGVTTSLGTALNSGTFQAGRKVVPINGSGNLDLSVLRFGANGSYWQAAIRGTGTRPPELLGTNHKTSLGVNSLFVLKRFASGAKISANSSAFAGSLAGHAFNTVQGRFTTNGQFPKSSTGFAGFQLANGDLGWIRLVWNGDASGAPTSVTAIDWAYNDTPGGSITAGQESDLTATPEPSSLTLTLLGAGSAGVLAWRKRRQQAAAVVTA